MKFAEHARLSSIENNAWAGGGLGTSRPTRFAVTVGDGAAKSAFLRIRK